MHLTKFQNSLNFEEVACGYVFLQRAIPSEWESFQPAPELSQYNEQEPCEVLSQSEGAGTSVASAASSGGREKMNCALGRNPLMDLSCQSVLSQPSVLGSELSKAQQKRLDSWITMDFTLSSVSGKFA